MTDKWIKDTGLVLVVVLLILSFKYGEGFLIASVIFLLLAILTPKIFYPLAFLWLKFVGLLNLIIPKIFFGAVFFIIIYPIGVLRRIIKGDTFFILSWRKVETVFVERNHVFLKKDIEMTY